MTPDTKTRRLVLLHALALTMLATGSVPLGSASAQAGDGYQRFIVECGFSHAAPDDPIVVPLQPGATHMHDFLGNRRTDHRPGYLRMKRGNTKCATRADTSAYWVPALRHRSTGQLVHATELRAYYYSTELMDDDPVVAFPRGYSAISDEAAWMCRNTERLAEPPDCTGRLTQADGVGLVIVFDQVCWSGVNVGPDADAPWSQHVTGLQNGECLAGHRQLPWLSLQVRYGLVDASNYEIVSAPSRGPHADFWNTWQQGSLADLVTRCLQPGSTDCREVAGR